MSDRQVTVLQQPAVQTTVLQPVANTTTEVGRQGPVGPQGPQGPAGTGLNYTHDQPSASAIWLITHSMGKYPSITVVDSAGAECEGSCEYLSPNQVRVTFSAPFSGQAFLN